MAAYSGHDATQRVVVIRAVAAYRDRWGITSTRHIGAIPLDDAQRIDCERTQAVIASNTSTIDDEPAAQVQRRDGRTLA